MRAYKICTSHHLPKELAHIKQVLLDNGYPWRRIQLIMERTRDRINKPKPPPGETSANAKVMVPFFPSVAKPLKTIARRHHVSVTFTSNLTLRNLLTRTKTPTEPANIPNVIYEIPCEDCEQTYCGQTKRPLHKRIAEHQGFTRRAGSYVSEDLQYKSGVAHHSITLGHNIAFNKTLILTTAQHSSQLDMLEHAAIKIKSPALNRMHSAPSVPGPWATLLPNIEASFKPRPAYPDPT